MPAAERVRRQHEKEFCDGMSRRGSRASSRASVATDKKLNGDTSDVQNECAICFDTVTESPSLPCLCKVSYCFRCWDRCLAQSYQACGRARCPTCRGPVRVDYDQEKGCLSFSPDIAQELSDDDLAEHRQQAAARLLEQARPAQRRLLEGYGEACPELSSLSRKSPDEMESAEVRRIGAAVEAAVKHKEWPSMIAESISATATLPARLPPCVCGNQLVRMSSKTRYEKLLTSFGVPPDHPSFQHWVSQYVSRDSIVCDLCSLPIDMQAGVWMCESNDLTILHAMFYDVCDRCLIRHACLLDMKRETAAAADA